METLSNVLLGLSVSLQPMNLLYCFSGVLVGTLVGVLPGVGPSAAICILLPFTLYVTPVSAIIMLAGIYYGAMYGGSTTSILVNIPGEAASVITCLDGYQMARQGRAGPALGISAIGSFIAGTLGVVGLMILAPSLANVGLKFGPPEYCTLMILGFTILGYLSTGSMIKAFMMATFGLILGSVGMDMVSGKSRFTFSFLSLEDGLGLIPVIMGLFGVSEVLLNVEISIKRTIYETRVKNLLPNLEDWKKSLMPILRGSVLGFFIGILPGPGPVTAAFSSYVLEKKVSKHPEKFGKGAIEGVAGPESANNSATAGAMIPMMTLGIPSSPVTALLLGALMIHGILPGPLMIKQSPDLFWGLIVSMYVGNIMLVILNLPLIGLWVRIVMIPYVFLFPLILLFCLIGSYSINYSVFDLFVMILFGVVGYLMKKFRFDAAPLIMAFVIGPMFEFALRQSLMLSHGSFGIFLQRPICVGFLITVSLLLVLSVVKRRPTKGLKSEED